ncbi:MAG: small, acid-soluble spore protein, alpha/beta type [Syntrophomonadaceae bacterium]|jgi:small acid-soluble spore protein F (minor alpha/beta-type SASP)|nr:small, acid-soluble spore protein, alpha/beta type [Bacillota bacterium]NLM88752.1 small, acid-soluble spore protein, alpha/beta type [Syntrophomonadaceae bacterium]HAA09498.1 small, acid-soluble spore protein, alpha/beta type [Syntrophomonas sp.]HQD90278.1 small, acid-soluble spore protein, alpha/beta type [Syntrophomonadaceae bacterium]
MSQQKTRDKKKKYLTEYDLLKMEIAKELGLWEQIEKEGWESLSNAACGRLGGIMGKRMREKRQKSK